MTDNQDLFTDYALQLFNSFKSNDIHIMHELIQSFKEDSSDYEYVFMPGLIYGLLYHMSNFLDIITDSLMEEDSFMSDYGIQYSMEREYLLENPILNVHKATEHVMNLMQTLESIEDFFKDND